MVIKTTVNIKIITETKFYTGKNVFIIRQLDACSVFSTFFTIPLFFLELVEFSHNV